MSKRPPLEPRPTGKVPDGKEMFERIMRRYPKTMARLREAEQAEEVRKKS